MKTITKKLSLLTLVLIFSYTSYAQSNKNALKGNGKVVTKTRTVGNYDEIKCSGSLDYILVSGKEGNITIEGEENLLEYIKTEVKDDKLIVKIKNDKHLKPTKGKMVKITIPFEDIKSVSLAGSGDLWNEDVISADKLDIALAGSGDLIIDANTSSIKGALAGSGDLILKGKTNHLKARVAGSGDFNGSKLQANHTDVAVAGSGDAIVVSNESLKARVAGSGDIKYTGNPEKEDTKVTGSGSISN